MRLHASHTFSDPLDEAFASRQRLNLVKSRPAVKKLADLASWSWISLAGSQFWRAKEIALFDPTGRERRQRISPVLISEGAASVREAAKAGLGVALLPDWLIENELGSRELVQVLPRSKARDLPIHVVYAGQRVVPTRVSAFIDFALRYLSPFRKTARIHSSGG